MKQSKGFSSLEFIVTLFFLSLIVIALGLFLRTSDLSIRKHTSKKEDIKAIDIILNLVFEEIKKDTTPSVDSLLDPVWKLNDTEIDGYKISIKSLSGLIGLNFINKNMLTKTNLKEAFNSPEAVDSVIEVISQEGPINSYEKISEFISEENFNKYFTLYEYANFNIADENVLRNFANTLSMSYFGDELISRKKMFQTHGSQLQNETELNLLCGIYYDDLYPFINVNPVMNINFISEDCLKTLLGFKDFKLSNINQKVNNIISLRQNSEITEENICAILGITKSDKLYYYLGCKTWMWQIKISGKKTSCNVILARAPEDDTQGHPRFYLIEKNWK